MTNRRLRQSLHNVARHRKQQRRHVPNCCKFRACPECLMSSRKVNKVDASTNEVENYADGSSGQHWRTAFELDHVQSFAHGIQKYQLNCHCEKLRRVENNNFGFFLSLSRRNFSFSLSLGVFSSALVESHHHKEVNRSHMPTKATWARMFMSTSGRRATGAGSKKWRCQGGRNAGGTTASADL